MRHRPHRRYITTLISLSFLIFISHIFLFDSTLSSPTFLGEEIMQIDGVLASWGIGNTAPFKYRVLFMWIVKGTHYLFFDYDNNNAFYLIYVLWSYFFCTSVALLLYYFLMVLNFTTKQAFVGCIMYFLSPPVLFAYLRPVHTREDFLAYLILLIGLLFIVKNNPYWILFISIIGVLCRETLLIIPFIYLLFTRGNIFMRIMIGSAAISIFFLLRYIIGFESYEVFNLGLVYNIKNKAESIAYFFLTFSILWLLSLLYYTKYSKIKYLNKGMNLLLKSAPWVFILIFLTTFIGGRISEIRLLFLFFPWVIPFALDYIVKNKIRIKLILKIRVYKMFLLTLFLISFCLLLHFYLHYWVLTLSIHLLMLLAIIPIIIKRNKDLRVARAKE